MQTICFDFFFPPDSLPRLQRNHGMDADTMLAQAQLLSCLVRGTDTVVGVLCLVYLCTKEGPGGSRVYMF